MGKPGATNPRSRSVGVFSVSRTNPMPTKRSLIFYLREAVKALDATALVSAMTKTTTVQRKDSGKVAIITVPHKVGQELPSLCREGAYCHRNITNRLRKSLPNDLQTLWRSRQRIYLINRGESIKNNGQTVLACASIVCFECRHTQAGSLKKWTANIRACH